MPQSDQERQAEIRAKLDKLREEHDQLLASLAEEDSGSGDLPEPLGEPDAENIETGDAAGSELPEPDPIVESNGVRIYEPPTGVASAQAPPETPEVASGTATKSHHPIPEPSSQLLASLAEEDSGSGDLPEPLGEPDAENIETGDAAGSELPEPDPIVESNGVRIYEPPTGAASAQAPPETPEVASGTATKSHHPIPEPSRSDASLGSDVDVDWTPEATKGLDLSDGEFLATPEEAEPGPSLGIDGVASGLEQYVVTIAGVLRQMEDILLEATRVQEDTRSRFDRIR